MFRTNTTLAIALALGSLMTGSLISVRSASAQSLDTPMTRLRPIGEPSAVDRYRPVSEAGLYRETAYQQAAYQPSGAPPPVGVGGSPVRQAVMLQQFEAPVLPGGGTPNANAATSPNGMQFPGGFGTPPPSTPPPAGNFTSPGSTLLPGNATNSLPSNLTPVPQSDPIFSSSDYVPLAQPQLSDGFATIDNCNCVTAPSSYIAASSTVGCAPVSYQGPVTYEGPANYTGAPAQIAAPAIIAGPIDPRRNGIPRGPLVSFGQDRNTVQVGQGIVGQPVAYVPGQRIRNWIRYIFP